MTAPDSPRLDPGAPVGVFDSGVGGLSVLRHLREARSSQPVVYVADTVSCPYGPKPAAVVRERVFRIVEHLVDRNVGLVVVACNTASTVALSSIRRRRPDVPFVGMEPAVKPAAAMTVSGSVGVLATATTARGEALARLIDRFGRGVTVHVAVPEGLVELVESGRGESPTAEAILGPILDGWRALGVDVVVLGCTHYPFARALVERLAGPDVAIVDPGPAVARQAVRVLESGTATARTCDREASILFLTTGDPSALRCVAESLVPATWVRSARYEHLSL